MDVPNTGDELSEELASIFLLEVPVSKNMIEEFAPGSIFQNDSDILVGLNHVV